MSIELKQGDIAEFRHNHRFPDGEIIYAGDKVKILSSPFVQDNSVVVVVSSTTLSTEVFRVEHRPPEMCVNIQGLDGYLKDQTRYSWSVSYFKPVQVSCEEESPPRSIHDFRLTQI